MNLNERRKTELIVSMICTNCSRNSLQQKVSFLWLVTNKYIRISFLFLLLLKKIESVNDLFNVQYFVATYSRTKQ